MVVVGRGRRVRMPMVAVVASSSVFSGHDPLVQRSTIVHRTSCFTAEQISMGPIIMPATDH